MSKKGLQVTLRSNDPYTKRYDLTMPRSGRTYLVYFDREGERWVWSIYTTELGFRPLSSARIPMTVIGWAANMGWTLKRQAEQRSKAAERAAGWHTARRAA